MFKIYKAEVKNLLNRKIKVIRSDRGENILTNYSMIILLKIWMTLSFNAKI